MAGLTDPGDDGGVIELTEPQVWTVILGMFALMAWLMRGVRNEIGSLRSELKADIGGLRAEMRAKFETVELRFDHLDRDVQAIAKRVFPEAG